MADSNKIRYGIKNVFYATASISTSGTASYGTPVALPGAVSLSLDAQGGTEPFYADNIVYYTSVANNGYEGDLELAKIPDSFLTDCLGYTADTNGVLLEDAGAEPVHFALMFQFEGDKSAKRSVLYNCVATRPSVAGTSKDLVKASCTTTESTAYSGWLSTVYQPT